VPRAPLIGLMRRRLIGRPAENLLPQEPVRRTGFLAWS
jgi:hypothetical protein